MHDKDEVLRVARLMAERVIKFQNKCKNQEYENDAIKCHDLDDIASLARMVTADLNDA